MINYPRSVILRLLRHAQFDNTAECWVWQKGKSRDGYARIQVGRKSRDAYRVAYEAFVGPVPEGLELDHLCRNRACINPAHLEPVTRRVNVLRGVSIVAVNARKTHCASDHPLSGDNLYIRPDGGRACRRCNADAVARLKLRRTA